jgi:SNF2 family DNA or RNA helicase
MTETQDLTFLKNKYGWLSTPMQHQLDCFNLAKDKRAYAYFMDLGTGKSFAGLMNATYLYVENKIDAMVIVAPAGMYRSWSDVEIPKHVSRDLPYKVAAWSSAAKKEEKKALKDLETGEKCLRILVMNIEAFVSDRALELVFDFMKKYRCLMLIDESTTIKSPTAKRSKVAINLGKFAHYRRIATGNPVPQGACDLWMQSEFLEKNLLGFGNFYGYRNRFCVIQDMKFGSHSFKRVVGYRDMDKLKQMIRQFAFVIKKENCLDLPPKVYQVIDIKLGQAQAKAYEAMTQDAFVALEGGEVTAQMVITQLVRLHQIAAGFLKPDHLPEVPFDESNHRLETLIECLEAAPGKCIIWSTYRFNIKQIIEAITKRFGKETLVHFYGDTTQEERKYAREAFQDPNSSVKYIVSNPATGKFGNTFNQATTVVYYNNNYNLEDRQQSEDRAHRFGQEGAIHKPGEDPSVLYIDLCARGTVDEKILKVLKNKKQFTDEVMVSNWRWLLAKEA